MQGKSCCGCCSLGTGTTIALTITAIQAAIGLIWNTELLMMLNKSEIFNPLHTWINVHTITDFDVVHGLTLAAIGLNVLWLTFAIVAGRGNITLSHGKLALWDVLTCLITLFDIGATIFFVIKVQCIFAENAALYSDSRPTIALTYLALLIAFSKGGIFIFINIYLAHVVQRRGKEIDHDHSALALYIISHIAQCNRANETAGRHPVPPPPYASSYPYYVQVPDEDRVPRTDSSGSQWSLSYEAIENMSHQPQKYVRLPGTKACSSLDVARVLSRGDSCPDAQIAIADSVNSSALPY